MLFLPVEIVAELGVLEVWEEPDEIQDLSARTPGFPEGKESKRRSEVPEALLNILHETGYLEVIYSKFLEVHECGKVTQGVTVKREVTRARGAANTKPLDEWKQAKIV